MSSGQTVILVEGDADKHVVRNLCRRSRVALDMANVKIHPPKDARTGKTVQGEAAVLAAIAPALESSDLSVCGVVLDADDDPCKQFGRVNDTLARQGYTIGKQLPAEGLIETVKVGVRKVRFGLWIMPDNQRPGELEDFYHGMIVNQDDMRPYVDGFLGLIPDEKKRFADGDRLKAWVHSWLAIQESPGRPMGHGLSIYKDHFNVQTDEATGFINWMSRLLGQIGPE